MRQGCHFSFSVRMVSAGNRRKLTAWIALDISLGTSKGRLAVSGRPSFGLRVVLHGIYNI